MADEQTATIEDIGGGDVAGRQRSTIGFPYDDLKSAVEMAEAVHNNVGTGDCDDGQLAAWTQQSPKSSAFRTQVYAARMFGLLAGEGGSKHRLTDLGRTSVDSNQSRAARSQAFLTVPLYRAVYERYKGGVLPPAAALERDMVGMGVSEKQKDRARQVFERAAEQAGFFEHGKNRLVAPGVPVGKIKEERKKGGDDGDPPDLHPFIQGLLKTLPPQGEAWDVAGRVKWLAAAAHIFGLIYEGDSKISIKADDPQ